MYRCGRRAKRSNALTLSTISRATRRSRDSQRRAGSSAPISTASSSSSASVRRRRTSDAPRGRKSIQSAPCRTAKARLKIVILGAGQVGSTLAESLVSEQNDITVVDHEPKRLKDLQDRLDLRTVVGSAAHPGTLADAG